MLVAVPSLACEAVSRRKFSDCSPFLALGFSLVIIVFVQTWRFIVDSEQAKSILHTLADQVQKGQRWRVNDNLPGTRDFCPLVVKTDVIARRTGQGELPLADHALALLQQEILGSVTTLTRLGIRQSPVFVGETVRYHEVVHYVAPPASDLARMLAGVPVFLARTRGQSPVLRSTVAAFALVYIHPLADGNGRVHRFLINDILRRDGAIPDPVILPVSAVISADTGERRAYEQILDRVSKPLMLRLRDQVSFASMQTHYPDGVASNLVFTEDDQARPLWRYPDLGAHVVYMSNVMRRTITEQMREESRYLRNHVQARQAIKEIIEMPDHQADRLLRSIEQNQGKLSHVMAKEMPALARPELWEAITVAVAEAFRPESPIDSGVLERYRPNRPAN